MLTADIFSSGKGMERTATFVGNVAFEENDQVEWNVISIEPADERQEILGFGRSDDRISSVCVQSLG